MPQKFFFLFPFQAGPPSNDDRLEILFLPVDADTPDPKAPFSAGTSPAFVLDVPLIAQ
ncbi:unnamed protein product [Meloidogyne enterolobii]|uniref:Uncharacterized protein n=1 Tax=Meloidogyne enterolobii TaxID=390850 RepID=A0ACB1A2M2_MELEN